ncbi:hypothetical protein E4U43_004334 [Claviceps pusilla]|uniref:Uncharacterized protein n=1 Tax=Claviceps pusilla TaxID=123648 RepID=A0A9P7SX41_9HYPO|nr:hypothetical protein E4U43_004334 [Claviceps pusilla]
MLANTEPDPTVGWPLEYTSTRYTTPQKPQVAIDDLNDSARVSCLGIWASKRVFDRTGIDIAVLDGAMAGARSRGPSILETDSHRESGASVLLSWMMDLLLVLLRIKPRVLSMDHSARQR